MTDPRPLRLVPDLAEDEIEDAVVESCRECGGILEHVVGCPEMDRAR